MNTIDRLILVAGISIALSACSVLKAGPAPDSGFLGASGELAVADERLPFHRVWRSEETGAELESAHTIYIAPVSLSHLVEKDSSKINLTSSTTDVTEDAVKIAEYVQTVFREELEKGTGRQIEVVDRPNPDALVLELALTELTPTDVARNVVGAALGAFVPGGGVVSLGSQGTIAIEGWLISGATGKVIFVFADRESGKLAPVSLNDFSLYSHARDAIDDWAEQWSQIIETGGRERVRDSSPITLLPI